MRIISRHHFYINPLWFLEWFIKDKKNNIRREMEVSFKKIFHASDIKFFSSATSAFLFLLDSISLPEGSVFILPEYNFFIYEKILLSRGFKIKYVPVGKDFLMDADRLVEMLDEEVKVVIVMNLFSRTPDLEKIEYECKNRNIIMISDCAHSFKTIYNNRYAAEYGDYSIMSFGVGKRIMCFGGGALISNHGKINGEYHELSDDKSFSKIINGLIQYFFTSKIPYSIFVFPVFWILNFINRDWLESRFFDDEENYIIPKIYKMPPIRLFLLKKQMEIYKKHSDRVNKLSIHYERFFKKNNTKLKPDYIFFQINSDKGLAKFLLKNGIDCRYDYCHFHDGKYSKNRIILPLYFSMSEKDVIYILNKIKIYLNKL